MASYGVGASLASYGQSQERDATQALGEVAKDETQREMGNKAAEQQRKAGNAQLGATGGAMAGMMVAGPWGALAGAAIGGVAGGLF